MAAVIENGQKNQSGRQSQQTFLSVDSCRLTWDTLLAGQAKSGASEETAPSPVETPKDGISYWMASVFIVGEIAGSGMLALPDSMARMGWSGVMLVLVAGLASAYAGLCLCRSWLLIESRFPELKSHSQKPFPDIADKAFGASGRVVGAVFMCISTLGGSLAYMLIVAQMMETLLADYIHLSYCYWILVIVFALTPVSWLGTPSDLVWVGILALVTTTVAWLFSMIQLSVYFDALNKTAEHPNPGFLPFFLGVGPILYAYGGAVALPTIQNDMKDRQQFTRSVVIAYTTLILLYLPMAVLGYAAVGNNVAANILETLKKRTPSFLPSVCEVLFVIHLVTAFFVALNPVFQQMESLCRIGRRFSVKRVLFRTFVMGSMGLIGEVMPDFFAVLDILGSTSIAMTSFILPTMFFYKLTTQTDPDGRWQPTPLPVWEKALLAVVVILGAVVGVTSTAMAVSEMVRGQMSASCLIAT